MAGTIRPTRVAEVEGHRRDQADFATPDSISCGVVGGREDVHVEPLAWIHVKAFTGHHAFLLVKMLARVDALDATIEQLAAPFAAAVRRLAEISGISIIAARRLGSIKPDRQRRLSPLPVTVRAPN